MSEPFLFAKELNLALRRFILARMTTLLHRISAMLLLVCVALLASCAWKGGPGTRLSTASADAWDIQPVRLRVYPSSRFVIDGEPMLETRIELFDAAGDSTKGVGHYRFELYPLDPATNQAAPQRLYSWDVPVLSLEDNRTHYDPVTRAYLFRLRIADASITQQPLVLQTTFTPVDAGRIEASAVLTPGKSPAASP